MTNDPKKCEECGKEKCPKKEHLHGGNGMGLCHGHGSEGEKEENKCFCDDDGEGLIEKCGWCKEQEKPQPKVCERCNGKGMVPKLLTTYPAPAWGAELCSTCRPPLPPKDGKGEEGETSATMLLTHLNERVYREFKKHGKTMDASTFAACVGAKMKDCVEDHLRQVAAKAREDDYSKAIEDAKEAVKLYCPKQQNHSAFEKGFDSCKRTVLLALDKLKKKYEMGM